MRFFAIAALAAIATAVQVEETAEAPVADLAAPEDQEELALDENEEEENDNEFVEVPEDEAKLLQWDESMPEDQDQTLVQEDASADAERHVVKKIKYKRVFAGYKYKTYRRRYVAGYRRIPIYRWRSYTKKTPTYRTIKQIKYKYY